MMGKATIATFHGDALLHALHMSYESIKRLVDEVIPDEEEQ
jgi:hypothetical protein